MYAINASPIDAVKKALEIRKLDFETKKVSSIADRFAETVESFSDLTSAHRLLAELSSASKIEASEVAREEKSVRMIESLSKLNLGNFAEIGTFLTSFFASHVSHVVL